MQIIENPRDLIRTIVRGAFEYCSKKGAETGQEFIRNKGSVNKSEGVLI